MAKNNIGKDNSFSEPFLDIKDLSVHFTNGKTLNKAVDHVDLHINKGEVVSIVGESGSGKSTIARATLSLWPHATGSITHKGRLLPSSPNSRNKFGSSKWIAKNMQMVFQDPYESLHPTWTVYKVATQGIKYNSDFKLEKEKFNLAKDIVFFENYFRYSGDLDKSKLANKLRLEYVNGTYSLKDEIQNTKASRNANITLYKNRIKSLKIEISAAKRLKKDNLEELTEKLISYKEQYKQHSSVKVDVSSFIDNLEKLKQKVSEQMSVWNEEVPKQNFKLKEFKAKLKDVRIESKEKLDIEIEKAKKHYEKVVNELKKDSHRNNSLIKFEKKKLNQKLEAIKLESLDDFNKKELKKVNEIGSNQPYAAAKFKIHLYNNKYGYSGKKNYIYKKVSLFLKKVGINTSILSQPISDLSGGQRQRIAIARSLVMNPRFLIADEPISALDVSIQAQVINILKDLKDEFDLTIMFIAHDLRMVRYISDRVYIMFRGKIVEHGDIESIFKKPIHPYTKTLLSAIPSINISRKGLKSYQYDLSDNLKERHSHEFHKIGSKEHYVLGTKELIKEWTAETKDFLKEFDYN